MPTTFTDNKRVAKNTLLLYARQLISLIISLFTVRVVLNTLGVDDYGIYNVVGGIVGMVSFLTSTLTGASQRFIAYDLAKGDKEQLNRTFSIIAIAYYIIGFVAVVLAEGVGVWFLNTYMNIPPDRMAAANWVLQFSIFQFALAITCAPYMADVVAHERIDVFAYVGIVDVVGRLIAVYLIVVSPIDKLITLAALYFLIATGVRMYYQWYCRTRFQEAKVHFIWDAKRIKELLSYSGWNAIGTCANIGRSHGINIILNLFFDPAINAARAVAYQVNNAINSFVRNFYTAVDPQIIKNYAVKEMDQLYYLIFMSSRLAFYLLLLLCIPISLNIDQILSLWLKNPPEYASIFVQFVLINTIVEVYSHPLSMGISATGNVRNFQIVVSGIYLMILPIAYLVLALGGPPESTLWVNTIVVLVCLIPRFYFCKKQYGLPVRAYFIRCIVHPFFVGAICYLLSFCAVSVISDGQSIVRLLLSVFAALLITFTVIGLLGISKYERHTAIAFIRKKINHR